ncbi:MAG: hypothetical protein H6667_06395 [Ardenticatenaceae bacterium]|nr:hypothetical protein [Ardenticatenaceae bacterium]MCB9442810.1 hypothetical protein [Ardenticatenaceae bacterium]
MRHEQSFQNGNNFAVNLSGMNLNVSRKATIGVILAIALLAFEMFNFDTTQYALRNLLGEVKFLGLQWASILAIAFCSIDFAGLARLFTPEKGADEPKEVWYLMGAWFLGATMNAVMTWWAVSLTLLNHEFGNEVLGRETLLSVVPVFVAVLVWLTRILFIGAFTVAGDHIFDFSRSALARESRPQPTMPVQAPPMRAPKREPVSRSPQPAMPAAAQPSQEVPAYEDEGFPTRPSQPVRQNSRIRQRPPMPNSGIRRVPTAGVQARSRNN